MSRRRGVVVSDDEETPAAATTSRQSRGRTVSSRRPPVAESQESSTRARKGNANNDRNPPEDIPAEILDLPSVSNYNPEEIQSLLTFKDENKKLIHAITASFNVISGSAVAVAEPKIADGKNEVNLF